MTLPSIYSRLIKGCAALLLAGWAATAPQAQAQEIKVDPKLKPYKTTSGVSGNLNAVGSDTLNNMMTLWSEEFSKRYPNVHIQVEGKGSSTAPPALAQNTAQLGPMSRPMKDEEIQAFEARHGYKPTAIGVSLDALAVFVNKDNPLDSITLDEVDGIFSKTRKSGGPDITQWGQLGLTGTWSSRPLSLYGRNSASGTYGFFKEHVLKKGDFRDTVKEQPGSSSVVMGVGGDPTAIGYSGMGYVTSQVKMLKMAPKKGAVPVAGTYNNVLNGKYPMGRMLYIYVAKPPGKPLPPLETEFLRFVLSREGQAVAIRDGFLPLPAPLAEKELAKLVK
ncbi:MAG: PstS family phosphate ABC transporter substrate-binding protein [Deltaproteobacteria bacterium]|nr:PstS family phosphate ABC transporter substrate-binding protein [Deltaproteobacteria bacterium]